MTVVAIVVAYDAGGELRDALAAYRKANVPVVVVDNGPNPPLESDNVAVHVIGQGNVGYGAGLNAGYRVARETFGNLEWVILANADVVPSQALLHAVMDDALPRGLDVVGFQDPDGSDAWRRPMPSVRASIAMAVGREQRLAERLPVEKTYAVGALLAVRGPTFESLDGFDPCYFLYFEEVDFIERAMRAGYGFGFAPLPLTYLHRAHTSTERIGAERWREIGRAAAIHLRNGRRLRLAPWLLAELSRLSAQAIKARLTKDELSRSEAYMTLLGLLGGLLAVQKAKRLSQSVFGWRTGSRVLAPEPRSDTR